MSQRHSSPAFPSAHSQALQQCLQVTQLEATRRQQLLSDIREAVLKNSRHMDSVNFNVFHSRDLEQMVREYDQRFLEGCCLAALNGRPLNFRLARRLTRAGGKTKWVKHRNLQTGEVREEFEISVSSHLLFQTFRDERREITVVGLPCRDRLEAMQRIVEHELIHLCEKLAWDDSSCRAKRFQEIAHRLFGHLKHTHDLVTTTEVARTQLGIRTGTTVSFVFEGRRMQGIVNKITKRATVLVPDPDGRPYSDGKRYSRYYVPLGSLSAVLQE